MRDLKAKMRFCFCFLFCYQKLAIVAHYWNPSTQKAEVISRHFEVSLLFIVCSGASQNNIA